MGSRKGNPTDHSHERNTEKFKKVLSDVDIFKTLKFGIRAPALIKTENEKCSPKREINLPPETYTDCIMITSTVASKSAYAPLLRLMFFSYLPSDTSGKQAQYNVTVTNPRFGGSRYDILVVLTAWGIHKIPQVNKINFSFHTLGIDRATEWSTSSHVFKSQ